MTDQTIGLLLMLAAILIAGAVIGFRGIKHSPKAPTQYALGDIPSTCQFIFYIGSLMNLRESSFASAAGHAIGTIFIGLVFTAAASIFWYGIFTAIRMFCGWYSTMTLPDK